MVKSFLFLMFALFLCGGVCLSAIYFDWQSERAARQWESLRSRAYEYYYRAQYREAKLLFEKARERCSLLGKTDYHYAISLADQAKVMSAQGEFSKARQRLVRAIEVFEGASRSRGFFLQNAKLAGSLMDDELIAESQLIELDVSSGESSQKIWLDCQQALKQFASRSLASIDPCASSELCQALLLAGDSAISHNDLTVSQMAFRKASEIAAKVESLSYLKASLKKRMNKSLGKDTGADPDELFAQAEAEVKNNNDAGAKALIEKIVSSDKSGQSSTAFRARYLLGKIYYREIDFENEEKTFLELLSDPKFTDDEIKSDLLDRLSMTYRQCGMPAQVAAALKAEYALKSKSLGSENSKVVDLGIELAVALQQIKNYKESDQYCQAAIKRYSLSDPKQEINASHLPDKLPGVLARCGHEDMATRISDQRVRELDSPSSRKEQCLFIINNYDRAALYVLSGKDSQCRAIIDETEKLFPQIEEPSRILISDGLRDWSVYLQKKKAAAWFIRQTVLIMPLPSSRREALRELATLNTIQSLKKDHPEAFTPELKAHIEHLRSAAGKFPPAKLQGLKIKAAAGDNGTNHA